MKDLYGFAVGIRNKIKFEEVNKMEAEMTRREFIQKFLVLSAAIAVFGKDAIVQADATVVDNLGGSNGISIGSAAPLQSSPYLFWLDTGNSSILKFRRARTSGNWENVSSVWS